MDKKINLGEIIGLAWKLTIKNFPYLLGLMGVVIGVNIVIAFGTEFFKKAGIFPLISYNIIITIIGIIIGLGLKKISISLIDGKKEPFSALYSYYNLTVKYFVTNIIYSLIVMLPIIIPLFTWLGLKLLGQTNFTTLNILLGLLILIGVIVSIFLALKFMFFSYYIVDKGSGMIESLKLSNQATKGEKMGLLILSIVLGLINIAGTLALVIGLIFTVPLTILASAAAYRKLAPATLKQ